MCALPIYFSQRVAVHSDASFARLLVGRSMAHRRSPTTGLQGADTRSTGSMVATRASGRAVTSASISPPNKRWLIVDRKSVVLGKSVSVRVDLGGSRIIKKKTEKST